MNTVEMPIDRPPKIEILELRSTTEMKNCLERLKADLSRNEKE